MPAYVAENTRERERLRVLVQRLSDDDLRRQVNPHWTVAAVLGHIAFWDARTLWLADKLEKGVPFTPSDVEPEDPSWINDSTRPFMHAIPPRELARLALRWAEEVDGRLAAYGEEFVRRTWPLDPDSLLNPLRAAHRGEHLDEIEAALGGGRG